MITCPHQYKIQHLYLILYFHQHRNEHLHIMIKTLIDSLAFWRVYVITCLCLTSAVSFFAIDRRRQYLNNLTFVF